MIQFLQFLEQALGVLCAAQIVCWALQIIDLFENERCCHDINAEKRASFEDRLMVSRPDLKDRIMDIRQDQKKDKAE